MVGGVAQCVVAVGVNYESVGTNTFLFFSFFVVVVKNKNNIISPFGKRNVCDPSLVDITI